MEKISGTKRGFCLLCALLVVALAGSAGLGAGWARAKEETGAARREVIQSFEYHLTLLSTFTGTMHGLDQEDSGRVYNHLEALEREAASLAAAGVISEEDGTRYRTFFTLYRLLIDESRDDAGERAAVEQDLLLFGDFRQEVRGREDAGERLAFDRFAAFFDEEHRADYARVKDRLPDDCLAEYFPELARTQE